MDDGEPRRTDTRDPRWSRERALKILFQADVRAVEPGQVVAQLDEDVAARAMLDEVEDLADDQVLLPPMADEPGVEVERVDAAGERAASVEARRRPTEPGAPLDGFTRSLVTGVHDHRVEIDTLIARYARRWQISRMPVVDRTVLRLATYELLHESTRPAIVIDQAVTLAKGLSTEDSGRYVNGVLESIRRHLAESDGGVEADDRDGMDEATEAGNGAAQDDAR